MEGQVFQAGVLGDADAVLDAGVTAVAGFEVGQVVVAAVGQEDLVAPPVGIEEAELGSGVGLFAAHDGPGARRPAGQVQVGW